MQIKITWIKDPAVYKYNHILYNIYILKISTNQLIIFSRMNKQIKYFSIQINIFLIIFNNKILLDNKVIIYKNNLQKQFRLYLISSRKQKIQQQKLFLTVKIYIQMIKQLNFFNKIFSSVKNGKNKGNYDIKKIESDLKQMINKQLNNFEDIFKNNQKMYKYLGAGVEFDDLKKMLNHKFAKDQNNRRRIQQLLKNIQNQYSNKIIKHMRFQINKNTDILHNMSQFQKIIKDSSFNINIAYQNDTQFKKNCQSYFKQLYQKYSQYLYDLRNGFLDHSKLQSEITIQQQKILQNLPQFYKEFKKNYKIQKNIRDQIYEQTKTIQIQIQKKYMKKNQFYKIDQKFKMIYQNSSQENRQKMKNVYLKFWEQKFSSMKHQLNQNHEKLMKLIQNQKKQLELMPQAISQGLNSQFNSIKNKIDSIQTMQKAHIQKYLDQKNFQGLLILLQKNLKIKNFTLKNKGIEAINDYYCYEIKQINLNNNLNISQKKLESYLKVYTSKMPDKIKEQIPQIESFHTKYIKKIKQQIDQNSNYLFGKFQKQMRKIQQINKLSTFKLSKSITTIQSSIIQNIINFLNFLKKFESNFLIQYQNLVQNLNIYLNNQKTKFQKQIQDIKIQYLEKIQNKFSQFKPDKNLEVNLKKNIYNLIISKQKCLLFNKFFESKHFTPNNLSQSINNSTLLLEQFEQSLSNKRQELENWRLQDLLINDTKQRLAKIYQKINNQSQVLSKMFYIINKKEDNKQQQIKKSFYQNNIRKIMKFKDQIIENIKQSFINPQIVNGQRVRIFYNMIQILKQNNINLINRNDLENLENDVKILLDNKYRQIFMKISKFSEIKQNYCQYQLFLNQLSKINKQYEQQLKILKNQKKQQQKKQQLKKNQYICKQILIIQNQYKSYQQKIKKQKKINQFKQKIQGDFFCIMKDIKTYYEKINQQIRKDYQKKTKQANKKIMMFINENLVKDLIIFKHAQNYYNCQQKIYKSNYSLKALLEKIKKIYKGRFIKNLYQCLVEKQSFICQQILQQPIFKSNRATNFIIITKGKSFLNLLKQISFINNNASLLKKFQSYYKDFYKVYDQKLENYAKTISREFLLSRIITQAKTFANRIQNDLKKKSSQNKSDIIDLVALIFALWTIIEADIDQQSDQIIYPYKPHPGQVLSIFLILGLDENQISQYKKKIIEIQTGQGKSIILGVLSAYFALIGFDVYEACYSKYLSQRDFENFQKFFNALSITQKITYDIFPQICKSLLNQNQKETFCQKVQKSIQQAKMNKLSKFMNTILSNLKRQSKKSFKQNKKILLIDQADIFLDQNYLGESYRPSIRYYTKNVENFIYYIWKKRNQASTINPQSIYKSQQFKNVIKEFEVQEFLNIMKNQVHGILRDLANYQNDVYQLIDGKIKYKEGDGLTDKIRYGYRTLFSYLHQYEINKGINISELNPQICIHFAIASFSYALLPKYFESILGVTGTLFSMNTKKTQIIQKKFQISLRKIPSIFPKSRKSVMFKQCTNISLYSQIVKSIQIQHNKKRPVLVFFKSKKQTYAFFDSDQFKAFKYSQSSSIVTYEIQTKNRDQRINQSTVQGQITLITMDYSRGTDFIVKGNKKQEFQGLHVISASLPQSYSDYVQLVGRTGRQGANGSVLIFTTSDAAILPKQISQLQGQAIIKLNQENQWKIKNLEIMHKIHISDSQHQKSLKIFGQQQIQIKQLLQNIFYLNQQPLFSYSKSYTAICIDGTSSMQPVFTKVKQVINGAMPDIYKAIKQSNVEVQFSIKIVVYRNYNSSHEKLIEFTNYQTNQENLVNWLKGVDVQGGWGNEAIEVCFQHINTLKEINQIILIGDAAANKKQDVIRKRSQDSKLSKGQKYWIQKGFHQTHYKDQLQLIKSKNIKIHSFYIDNKENKVKPFFDLLSKQTKGESKQFLINQNNATKKFADFVTDKILDDLKRLVGSAAGKLLQNNLKRITKDRNYFG